MSWQDAARRAAKRWGIDPSLFERQMGQEAHGEDLTSPAGAAGPAQIMPKTAEAWGVRNVHNRGEAYDAAAKHMAEYARKYGGFRNALVAYNAGPGRVGGDLPAETRDYIERIMGGHTPQSSAVGTPPPSPTGGTNLFATIARLNQGLVNPDDPIAQQQQANWSLMAQIAGGPEAQTPRAGTVGSMTDGGGNGNLQSIISRASRIDSAELPYKWGGGHGDQSAGEIAPLDCSGAVSKVLGIDPRVSGQFESWGKPGRGKQVTIYSNEDHVLMEINGHFWGTSAANPGGGAGWIPRDKISNDYLKRFTARHPKGL